MSNTNKYKIGDIVKLKSGGPEMTVQILPDHRSLYYKCQWFAGKKLESGVFQEDSLEAVE
ncbi:YodC family protein [Pseudoalteromonas sp. 68 DY56-GL68]|uniref:YodC family protein n=1 Tax=Pseudoalteromonas sp. 68 DY56-GL68 TaxID=2974919 RepID=UPI00352B440D